MGILFGRGVALCGHKTQPEVEVRAFGDKFLMTLPRDMKKRPILCAECLAGKAIRCAWCNRVIFVGEFVTLCPAPKNVTSAESHTVLYGGDSVVGCLHPRCPHPQVLAVGIWTFNVTTGAGYVGEIEPGSRLYEMAKQSSRWAQTKPAR